MQNIIKILLLLLLSKGLLSQNFQQTTVPSGLPDLGNSNAAWGDYDQDGDYDLLLSGIDDLTNISCALYRNNGDTTFTNTGILLPQIYQGDVLFLDFNNDNFLDIAVSGKTDENLKITELYSNNGDGSFTKITTDIDSVSSSSLVAADFNNDGTIDILISGTNNSNERVCSILKNTGSNTFQKLSISVEGISNGSIQPADFDKDGKTDLLVFGINNLNQRVGIIYMNEGDFNFSPLSFGLPALAYASSAVGDYNQDGYVDFVVTGMDQSGTLVSKIFKNNGNGTFTDINAGLEGVNQSSSKWGDSDNDGDLDLILCGFADEGRQTILYENQGSDNFAEVITIIEDIAQGELNFVDFDQDMNLDVIGTGYSISGAKTVLYHNLTSFPAENPSAPVGTDYEGSENLIILKWTKGNDNQTLSTGLTYDILIGTSKFAHDIVSSSADISTGFRYIAEQGHCFTDTFAIINDLPEGKYYWQVQAIDNGFLGSQFSEPDSFIVCEPINLGNDTSICLNDFLQLSIGEGTDVVNWYSAEQGLLVSGSFNLDFTVIQTDTIWAELSNDLGCFKVDSIMVTPIDLPVIDLPSDTTVCKGSLLNLQTGAEPDSVNWYSHEGLLEEDTFEFSIQINFPDTVWAEVFSEFGCVSRDTIIADTLTLPYFTLGQDTAACYSDMIEFNVTGFDSINWYSLYELILADSEIITRQISEDDTLICETFNELSCSFTDTIISYMRELPVANTGNDTTICYNTTIILGANPAASGGTPPYSYSWHPADLLSDPSEEHPTTTLTENMQYIFTVSDSYNCSDDDTIYISVNPETTADVPNSYNICQFESIQLGGNPIAQGSLFPYVYNWSPTSSLTGFNSANPVGQPKDTTEYRLILSTYLCDADTFYVKVNVSPAPVITAGDDVMIGSGETIVLEANGGLNYRWYPDLYLDDYMSQNPVASPIETITYIVTGEDEIGCANSDSVTVKVFNEIFIPNLFTPNNDGNNDTFKVYGTGIDELFLQIFNREGKIVFESNNKDEILQTGWDGTNNGQLLPDAAYIWILRGAYNDGTAIEYKGNREVCF
jgi:gliding motility-associated-like protein